MLYLGEILGLLDLVFLCAKEVQQEGFISSYEERAMKNYGGSHRKIVKGLNIGLRSKPACGRHVR